MDGARELGAVSHEPRVEFRAAHRAVGSENHPDHDRQAVDPGAQGCVTENFGVNHPLQIVDFDCARRVDPKTTYMLGPQGVEVPFQLLRDAKIAVQASLAANASAEWKLYTGRAPQRFPNAVHIAETAAGYEIANGLTGVRIAREGHPDLAPIQGILYRDGQWTATGPNLLHPDARPTGMTVRFLERGPLKVIVEVAYQFDRPALVYGGRQLLPAGPGFYRSTIEMQADQPSILIEDDMDTDLRYSLDICRGLDPDQARYRGHHSTSVANGRQPDGSQYLPSHMRPQMDATRELDFHSPAFHRMAVWDPWVYDSGWYWQLYNSRAPAAANLLGIFAGRASVALGDDNNGAGIFTGPGPAAALTIEIHRRGPDARVFPRVRFAWSIFVATKAAISDPMSVQEIGLQMNIHSGIDLNRIYRLRTDFPDPPRGYGSLFMKPAAVAAIVARVRSDDDYFRYFNDAEPSARPLLAAWRDLSGAKR